MIYEIWSEADPMETIRHTDDALTDNPPRDCTVNLDEVAECARCGQVIRYRDGYPSLDLHVACTARSGYHDGGEDYPALICMTCALMEGQECVPLVDEYGRPVNDQRIEALERNLGKLVGAMRELTDVVRRMLGAYVVDENGTVSE